MHIDDLVKVTRQYERWKLINTFSFVLIVSGLGLWLGVFLFFGISASWPLIPIMVFAVLYLGSLFKFHDLELEFVAIVNKWREATRNMGAPPPAPWTKLFDKQPRSE